MILFTCTLPNHPKINSVKYLTHSVWLNHWSYTKFTHNQVSELAKKWCLLSLTGLLKEWSHNKHSKVSNTSCILIFAGPLTNDPEINSVNIKPEKNEVSLAQ